MNTADYLLKAVNEMQCGDEEYSCLDDSLMRYSPREVIDMWLRYEGICGYTDRILRALCAVGLITADDIEDDDYWEDEDI